MISRDEQSSKHAIAASYTIHTGMVREIVRFYNSTCTYTQKILIQECNRHMEIHPKIELATKAHVSCLLSSLGLFFPLISHLLIYRVCLCVRSMYQGVRMGLTRHGAGVAAQEQPSGIVSLLPSCEFL